MKVEACFKKMFRRCDEESVREGGGSKGGRGVDRPFTSVYASRKHFVLSKICMEFLPVPKIILHEPVHTLVQ